MKCVYNQSMTNFGQKNKRIEYQKLTKKQVVVCVEEDSTVARPLPTGESGGTVSRGR